MKQKIEESVIIKLLLIIIILFFFNFNSILYNIFLNYLFSYAFEIKKIEKYFILCNSERLINRIKFKRIKFPKVSIISPVHNREKFILRFIRSIQNQKFNDIEIIFIDDFSKDKSIKLIEKYQEKDGRIILTFIYFFIIF
jgi:cellulose synthase/poly-beta-1,6-N-acetylglucosamine synthase-like glycosyltransferase